MRRSRFLPVFFTLLAIAFVIALVIRLRSDMRQQTIAAPESATSSRFPVPTNSVTAGTAPDDEQPGIVMPNQKTATGNRQLTTDNRQPTTAKAATGNSQPATAKQPSLISRVLAPIAKVLAPTQSKPATKPPDNRQPATDNRQLATDNRQSGSGNRQLGDAQEQPKDPNSDTTPPQLMAVEFAPPQIEDGQQTAVIISATDDLSGVRAVSGTLSSPSGKALQGFATQREGDGNRYVARVTIAKNAEQGLWKISFINMSDNASNSVTLSFAQGTVPQNAVLRVVSSDSDNTPPTLKNVWADKRAIHNGEKDVLFVEAEDDKSGVNLVSAVFRSPSKIARIGAGCTKGDGDVWQCELNVPSCVDCGDWQLEQITLQDKANNLATFRGDNPLVAQTKINIAGSACDSTAPTLTALSLDSNDIVLGDHGAVVTVTIAATDDNCGVSGASGQFVGPGPGSGGFFPLSQSSEGVWTGRIQLDPRSAKGTWRINSIQLNDAGHNLRVYYASDPLLATGVFHVR